MEGTLAKEKHERACSGVHADSWEQAGYFCQKVLFSTLGPVLWLAVTMFAEVCSLPGQAWQSQR